MVSYPDSDNARELSGLYWNKLKILKDQLIRGKASWLLNLRPVGDVVQDVIFNQGLDFCFFRIGFSGGNYCNGILGIKPADFIAADVINSKDAPVEFMGMFFFLDGPDHL